MTLSRNAKEQDTEQKHSSGSVPFIAGDTDTVPCTHVCVGSARASTAPSISSELQIWYPEKLRRVRSDWAQRVCWIRLWRTDDTDASAHRLIIGLLPEQHWMVAAERRVRSEGCQTRRISHGSRTRMLFYMYPHKRMTTSKQTCTENFQFYIWRGAVIEIFF